MSKESKVYKVRHNQARKVKRQLVEDLTTGSNVYIDKDMHELMLSIIEDGLKQGKVWKKEEK